MGVMGWLKLAPYMALGVLVLWVWFLWNDRAAKAAQIDALEYEVMVANMQAAQAREAAAVLDAYLERDRQRRAEQEAYLQELRQREGYDEPLDGFLRDVFDEL